MNGIDQLSVAITAEIKVERSDPWFTDGNLVISCEGAARFRVHSGLLARHSEIFRNLFKDAIVPSSSTFVEGCPTVDLTDTLEDCQNLMLALYGPVTFKSRKLDDFIHTASLLRMATKYCVDWLRNKAIAFLSRYSPHTLNAWTELCRKSEKNTTQEYIPHPALIINLARSTNALILLPMALYQIGRRPAAALISLSFSSSKGPIPPSMYQLGIEDVYNCLRYQQRRLVSAHFFLQFIESYQPSGQCTTPAVCPDVFPVIASHVRSQFLGTSRPPIGFISLGISEAMISCGLCSPCRKFFIADVNSKQDELWAELPTWFDLPPWEVLTSGFVPENEL